MQKQSENCGEKYFAKLLLEAPRSEVAVYTVCNKSVAEWGRNVGGAGEVNDFDDGKLIFQSYNSSLVCQHCTDEFSAPVRLQRGLYFWPTLLSANKVSLFYHFKAIQQ